MLPSVFYHDTTFSEGMKRNVLCEIKCCNIMKDMDGSDQGGGRVRYGISAKSKGAFLYRLYK